MTTADPRSGLQEVPTSPLRFGAREVVKEFYSGALVSMYLAGPVDDAKLGVAIKAFRPPAALSLQRALAVEGFLAAVEEQRAVAGAAKGITAPVLDAGPVEGGCYVARPFYRYSLQFVSDAHLVPQIERLHGTVQTVLKALEEWARIADRPHGNFKAGNVFFNQPLNGAAPWSLVLVDPWFQPGDTAEKRQARDMEQLGRWIVRWVRRRDAVGWNIEDSPEWNILGRAATPWREFCNSLLDVNAPAETRRFEAVWERFARIPARPPAKWAAKAAVGGVIVAAAAVSGYARLGDFAAMPGVVRPLAEKLGNPGARVDDVPVQFGELCTEWDQWLAAMLEQLESEPMRARWRADPVLAAEVLALLAKPDDLDPRVFTNQKNSRFEALRDSPPDAARRTVVVEKVLAAHVVVGRVKKALTEWAGWKRRADVVAEWTARGWSGAASAFAFPPPPNLASGNLGRAIDEALINEAANRPVFASWSSFQADSAALQATNDPVQAVMPAYYAATVGNPETTAEFAIKLAAAAREMKVRADFARGDFVRRTDRERYLAEPFVRSFAAPLTAEALAQWDKIVPEYFRVEGAQDPRRRVDWEKLLREIDDTGGKMAEAEKDDPDTAKTVAVKSTAVTRDAAEARNRLQTLRNQSLIVQDVPRAVTEVAALEQEVTAILTRARDALDELLPNLDKLLAWLRARTFRNAIFQTAWTERANRLANAAQQADRGGNRDRFKQVGRAARALAGYFDGAEKAVSELRAIEAPGVDPEVSQVLGRLETQRRDELARAVITNTTFRDESPAADWLTASAGGVIAGLFDSYRRWQTESAEFGRDLAALGGRLREGFGWSEGVDALLAALTPRAQTALVEALGGATTEWIQTARRLQTLGGSSDAALLRSAAADPAFSVRLTAWRRLGELPDWPSSAGDLEIEGALGAEIRKQVEGVAGAGPRQQSLLAELRDQTRTRWNRAARRTAGDEARLTAVLDLMVQRNIPREDLDGDVRFNYGLRAIKAQRLMQLTGEEVRRQRDAFVADVRKVPAVVARNDVKEFLRVVEEFDLSSAPRELTARELGPVSAGWTAEFANDRKRVTFRWKSPARGGPEYAMDFVLVEPADSAPFFLAVEAVSVGAFIDLLEYHPAGRDVSIPEWIADVFDGRDKDRRRSPQSWEVEIERSPQGTRLRQTHLKLSSGWLPNPDPAWPKEVYARPAEAGRPTKRSPAQSLPPDLARKFTQVVLGARLPTPEEWLAIARLYGTESGEGNFRDEAWQRQQRYVMEFGSKEQGPWPDAGMFVPPSLTNIKRKEAAEPAVRTDDSKLWFSSVDEGPEIGGVRNLFGNVGIYLFDESTGKFFVAGGSAISPPEIDPLKTYDLPRNVEDGFADVGFRPAFDASPELIQRARFMQVLRQQRFLTQ